MYEEHLKHAWPGPAIEGTEICNVMKLENVNFSKVKKEDIKEAIFMKKELEKYSKLENIKHEDFRTEKEYMKQK